MERNIRIKMVVTDELPLSIHGCCGVDGDDGYIMAINGNDDPNEQAVAFLHECLHIWHRDFERRDPAGVIETERAQELPQLLETMRRRA